MWGNQPHLEGLLTFQCKGNEKSWNVQEIYTKSTQGNILLLEALKYFVILLVIPKTFTIFAEWM
jgi:hypothetical protein